MFNRVLRMFMFMAVLMTTLVCGGAPSWRMFAETQTAPATQDKTRARRINDSQEPSPSSKTSASPKEELPQESDEVVRVETNLTNIFFTAADKNKRFIDTLKREDVRVLEDDKPQDIFTFQPNIDLPLSIAILIDTSASEERTLPEEKAAARSFLEAVMRHEKDEAAIVSFTGDVTLEQGFTGNLDRLLRAVDRVEFVPCPYRKFNLTW